LVETTLTGIAQIITEQETTVNLISIFDKAEVDNISDNELKDLIKAFRSE